MLPQDIPMNGKAIAFLTALGSMVLIGCAGSSNSSHDSAEVAQVKEVAATGTEQTLLAALNAERRTAGKGELTISPKLAGLARRESDAAAVSQHIPGNTTAELKARSGFGSIGKLQGALKDRGTQTGKAFVDYWAKGEREMLLDAWSMVGVGVSKAADGRLFAVVVLGNAGGGGLSLMHPAMPPRGF